MPFRGDVGITVLVRSRHERDTRGQVAVRERETSIGCRPHRRTDPWHDPKLNLRVCEGFGFLSPAREEKRIAPFETHDAATSARVFDEESDDLGLFDRVRSVAFTDRN